MSTRVKKLGTDQENRLRLQASTERQLAQGRVSEAAASWTQTVELSKVLGTPLSWVLRTGKVLLERVCLALEPAAALPVLLGEVKALEGLGTAGLDLQCQAVLALAHTLVQLSNRKQAEYWLTKALHQTRLHPAIQADRASLALSLCKLAAEEYNHLEALQFAQQAVCYAEAQGQVVQRAVGLHNWAVQLERLGQGKQAQQGFAKAVKVLETHGSVEDMALLAQMRQTTISRLQYSAPSSPHRSPKANLGRSPQPVQDRSLQVSPERDSDLQELDSRGYLNFSRDDARPRSVIRRVRGGRRRPASRGVVVRRRPKVTIERLQAWVRGWIARKRVPLLRRKGVVVRFGKRYESGRYGAVVISPAWQVTLSDIQTGQDFHLSTTSRAKAEAIAHDLALDSNGLLELHAFTRLQQIWKSALTRDCLERLSLSSLPLTKPHMTLFHVPRTSTSDTMEPDSLSNRSDSMRKLSTITTSFQLQIPRAVQQIKPGKLDSEEGAIRKIQFRFPQNRQSNNAAVAIQRVFRGYISRLHTHLQATHTRLLYRGVRLLQPGVLCYVLVVSRGNALHVNVSVGNRYLSQEFRCMDIEELLGRIYVSEQLMLSSEPGPLELATRCVQRWVRGFLARRRYRELQMQTKRKLVYLAQKTLGAEVYHIALYQYPDKIQVETFKVCKQRQLKYHTYSNSFQLEELHKHYGQIPIMAALFEDLQLNAGGHFWLSSRRRGTEKLRSSSRPRASKRALIRASKHLGENLWVVTMTKTEDTGKELDCKVEFSAYSGGATEPLQITAQLSTLAVALALPLTDVLAIGKLTIQKLLKLEQGQLVLDLSAELVDRHRVIVMLQAHVRGFIARRKYQIHGHKSGLISCQVVQQLHSEWVFYAYRTPPSIRLVAHKRHSPEHTETSIPDTIFSRFPPSITNKRVMEKFVFPQLSISLRDGQYSLLVGESILAVPKRKAKLNSLAKSEHKK